ncbi:MAG TPA: hypothetical protein VGC48_05050, partial [Gemmatimonadales bacterium]
AAVLVNPDSVDSIAEGIRRVLDDAPLRQELLAAGRLRSQAFHWRRCATETLRVLERVQSERTPVPGRRESLVPSAANE